MRTDARVATQEYAEEFRQELDEAVKIRLRADVPVGCYLSGGLDSCAVLGLAAPHHPEPIRAFTLTFDRGDYDEGPIAREMAARVGAEFYPIPIRQDDLADNFADATAQSEQLCLNAHGVAKYMLSRAVRDAGYKVVLTGEGSDEILGGYAHFRRDMLLYNTEGQDPAAIPGMLADLEAANPVSRGILLAHGESAPMDGVKRILGNVPSWFEVFSARAVKMQPLFSPAIRERFVGKEPYRELLSSLDVQGQLAGREPVNQALVPLVQDRIARLHPDRPGRPHGDGPFHRGPGAVPRSSPGGGDSVPAGGAEDPGDDREVRLAGSGEERVDRHGLQETEASVPESAGNPQSRPAAPHSGAGQSPGSRAGSPALLRSHRGFEAAGPAADHGRGLAGRERSDPDDSAECMRAAGEVLAGGVRRTGGPAC